MKIEYDLYENFTFFILITCIFFVNCDFYDYIIEE